MVDSILLLMILAVLVIAVVLSFLILRKRREYREQGVKLLQALRMLVKHIQMHRGLTAVFLGNGSVGKDALYATANMVAQDINDIVGIEPSIVDNENWQGITRHWAKLGSAAADYDIYDSYDQHCKLVSACISLMHWVANEYRVHVSENTTRNMFWYELLELGEFLGQLRALGVVWLTFSNDPTVRDKCRKKVSRCLKSFENIYLDKKLQEKIGVGKCEEMNTFIASVDHYIIRNKDWISVDRYFRGATETMDVIYTSLDEEMYRLLTGSG